MTPRELVCNTDTGILVPSMRKQKDWFNENLNDIKHILDEKHCLHKTGVRNPKSTFKKDALHAIHRTIQQKLCKMQKSCSAAKLISKATPTDIIWRTSMMHWKKSMAPCHQDHPLSSAQMETCQLMTDEESGKMGWTLNILNLSSSVM